MEDFTFEHEGVQYTAQRTVTGTRVKRQTIHFQGMSEVDSKIYGRGEFGQMEPTAKLIAWQILTGRSLSGNRR